MDLFKKYSVKIREFKKNTVSLDTNFVFQDIKKRKCSSIMHTFTIGIEEEYQIIDAQSRDLISHVSKIIESGKTSLEEHLKHEMHESIVEMETGICNTVQEAREELYTLRKKLIHIAHEQNLRVAGGGTHPFSRWQDNQITQNDRFLNYIEIAERLVPYIRKWDLHM